MSVVPSSLSSSVSVISLSLKSITVGCVQASVVILDVEVRRLARKAERDAKRAASIVAYRASLGIEDPLALAEQ
jgi:hypothetical protein